MPTIDELFDLALQQGASDIHLIVGLPPYLRINGELQAQNQFPLLRAEDSEALCFSILTESQRDRFIKQRDLDISYTIRGGSNARARINLNWEKGNAGLVARVIPSVIPSLDEILVPPIVPELLKTRRGMILVTGPTGCGKSTTLASMISYINETRTSHIVTLEDPIEFIHSPKKSIIRQRQLGSDVLTFLEGLRHVVREDPDIVMVGEMRDLETISATLTLAETGHLVLATLHTANAVQTIDRIIDAFPPHQQNQIRLQLSLTLKAVISKKLLPRIEGGRLPVYEVLINTTAISTVIRDNRTLQIRSILETSGDIGMVNMDKEIERYYKAGEISKETRNLYTEHADYII